MAGIRVVSEFIWGVFEQRTASFKSVLCSISSHPFFGVQLEHFQGWGRHIHQLLWGQSSNVYYSGVNTGLQFLHFPQSGNKKPPQTWALLGKRLSSRDPEGTLVQHQARGVSWLCCQQLATLSFHNGEGCGNPELKFCSALPHLFFLLTCAGPAVCDSTWHQGLEKCMEK